MTKNIIPSVDPSTIPFESERLLYQAFRDQLPDEYAVFHSYPWLRPNRDLTLREGEADFLILHQSFGMLVLEAKGGLIDYQAPLWKRKVGKRWEVIKDPFEQAKKNMHKLNEIVEAACDGDVLFSRDYAYGYCAAFPTHNYNGRVPNNSDPAIIISHADMKNIKEKIEAAFGSWNRGKPAMDNRKYSKLVNALLPEFKLFRPISVNLQADLAQIKELTKGQIEFFRNLTSDRVYVNGVAGSGKTYLAMDRARHFAKSKKTLLVCYNKELALWWREIFFGDREQVSGPVIDGNPNGRLSILWFHSLASHVAKAGKIPFDVPDGYTEKQAFYRDEAAQIIEQAVMVIDENSEFQFDAIVLDEGQDFHPAWWDCLNYCLLKYDDKGVFYAFADPAQSLWEWADARPNLPFQATLNLEKNCRNTRSIAISSSNIMGLESDFLERSPIGLRPSISQPPSFESAKGIVIQTVKALIEKHGVVPREIAIIGPKSFKNGSLTNIKEVAGISFTESTTIWRENKGVLVTTARAFKGLEADAVIVYDLGKFQNYFTRVDLYVACTRARSYLHLIVHHPDSAKLISDAIELGWKQATEANGEET
jgi:hypothetical protein